MKWISGWAFPDSALAALDEKTSQFPMVGSWSLGSFQSLEMVMKNPRDIRAMVLVSSTARFCAAGDYAFGLAEGNLRAMQRGLTRDACGTMNSFHRLCAAPEVLDDAEIAARMAASLALGLETLAEGLRDLREKDFRKRVGEITSPVLLLHGEEDRVISCDASRWLAAHLPNAKLVTLPGAGHDLPIRNSDWVAERIAEFGKEIL